MTSDAKNGGVAPSHVKGLLMKQARGAPMVPVNSMQVANGSITGNVTCTPLRQVLILPEAVLQEFNLSPGDLRENIIVDHPDMHELPSGTAVIVGTVRIRLTFHCEPCKVISKKVNIRRIVHRRGYLGSFLSGGVINVGDTMSVLGKDYEEIPYDVKDRIRWYLRDHNGPVPVTRLVFDIGLSKSYCRVIPLLVKSMADIDPSRIVYAKGRATAMSSVEEAAW